MKIGDIIVTPDGPEVLEMIIQGWFYAGGRWYSRAEIHP